MGAHMIVREWRGRAPAAWRAAYPQHFRAVVVPQLRAVEGFRGGRLLEREHDGMVEFVVQTLWASMDAVRGFAGDDVERAVLEPGALAALSDPDAGVTHYRAVVLVEPPGTG